MAELISIDPHLLSGNIFLVLLPEKIENGEAYLKTFAIIGKIGKRPQFKPVQETYDTEKAVYAKKLEKFELLEAYGTAIPKFLDPRATNTNNERCKAILFPFTKLDFKDILLKDQKGRVAKDLQDSAARRQSRETTKPQSDSDSEEIIMKMKG
jgi:hypothetical protein